MPNLMKGLVSDDLIGTLPGNQMTVDVSEAPPLSRGAAHPQASASAENSPAAASLFGPVVDFFALGGFTFIVVPLFFLLPETSQPTVAAVAFALANVINHPHFAHSYQLFYRGFWNKVSDTGVSAVFRLRYAVAGVLVPIALSLFLIVNFLREDIATLGLAGNLMAFLVGWHYVKQGYGMLIVQSVLKRQFFRDAEKRLLVINSYACWISSWLLLNYMLGQGSMWGVEYFVIPINVRFVYVSGAFALLSTAAMVTMLVRKKWDKQLPVPWAGIVAYVVSIYIWLLASLLPMLILIVPALHSLQYLLVVWRFELNFEKQRVVSKGLLQSVFTNTAIKRFSIFIGLGVLLGYIGFFALPYYLESHVELSQSAFSSGVFLFMTWIFINVHHYFIDNVLWRRENPETGKYLFTHH